jgi:uncharacterized protein YqjF (DUF2071 family)
MTRKPFMTTTWSNLAMLNYEVDPTVLRPYVPVDTELDEFQGRHFASVVGFLFSDTKIFGMGMPGYRQFCEVNLRFYVRHRAADGWRRGVVFIKEVVARRAVAWMARTMYDEHFERHPMRFRLEPSRVGLIPARVEYAWQNGSDWNELKLITCGPTAVPEPGSEAEFITEHYWGYTARRDGSTSEYHVEHPPWRVTTAARMSFQCDIGAMYGKEFIEALSGEPSSAFLAEGSPVVVYRGYRLNHLGLHKVVDESRVPSSATGNA